MATPSECSASPSPDATRDRLRPLATQRTHSRSLSVRRWLKSWLTSAKNQPSKIFSRICKYSVAVSVLFSFKLIINISLLASPTPSPNRSLRSAPRSSHLRTSSSRRSRSSRSPSSISPSSWSSTRATPRSRPRQPTPLPPTPSSSEPHPCVDLVPLSMSSWDGAHSPSG